MLTTKQALMVKFCLTSQRQNLGLIVEDENQLVLCTLPYASAFRPTPEFRLPTDVAKPVVQAVMQGFMDFPTEVTYADAFDEYQIAFDHFLENKVKEAAIKRGETPKTKKDEELVSLTLTRKPAPKSSATRSTDTPKRGTVTPRPAREIQVGSKKGSKKGEVEV
jgi:non-homologous end joining protein Ku